LKIRDVLVYLVRKLGSKSEGRKKLMKLAFLVEHLDVRSGRLRREPRLGDVFFIYYYGVFSFDVMREYENLVREGVLVDGYPVKLGCEVETRLEEGLKRDVDEILEHYGDRSGYELELETLRMLGIEPHEKDLYFGKRVDKLVSS